MNTSLAEAKEIARHLAEIPVPRHARAILCPPFTHLSAVSEEILGTDYVLGAQNVSQYDNGAFTGEVSAEMLKELHAKYVIVGHSERRALFLETDDVVHAKLVHALKHDLSPILCVGEDLAQREAGRAMQVVGDQLKAALADLEGASPEALVIAYEPIWAIGTGVTATAAQAEEMCAYIKEQLKTWLPGVNVPVLYGGSVKPDNIRELMASPSIDGALVGGASLKVDSYLQLLEGTA